MRSGSVQLRRRESLMPLREAARKLDVGHRTLERWRSEGMTVVRDRNRLLVRPEHVRAWKRWKSLQNVRARKRRREAAEMGVPGAVVSQKAWERARREWIAAGGREES